MIKKTLTLIVLSVIITLNVDAQAPTITSFSPDSGAVGTLITVVGKNLGKSTAFTVGGTNAIVVSDTSVLISDYGDTLVGLVMPGTATGAVTVTTANGSSTKGNFKVKATLYPGMQQGNKLVGAEAVGNAFQGYSVSISADGNTAIVGGYVDNNGVGAAWIYTRSGGIWTQQGNKLVGSGAAAGATDQGTSVSISADGNTAIVGGAGDNSGSGAAWVYTRSGEVWTQQGNKLVGSGATGEAKQGTSVSISADGNTAILGGYDDNSGAGAVWVFIRSGGVWAQQGSKLVGTGAVGAANQSNCVSISADGNTVIVGGYADNSGVGAAWIYIRSGGVWMQQGSKLIGTGTSGSAFQGISVSISADGNTVIVGGSLDSSNIGAAWVYTRTAGAWSQQGNKLVGSGVTGTYAYQGSSVSLSADGNTAVVGGEDDNTLVGATWVYRRSGGLWTQQGNKLSGSGAIGEAHQGASVSVSADGNTAIVGGYFDNSNAGAAWIFFDSSNVATGIENLVKENINSQIFPNPFQTTATIKFSVPSQSPVKLELFDLSGKKIETLAEGIKQAGEYTVPVNNRSYVSGMYFYRLQIGDAAETKKLIVQ
jgi:hypothetical protein